MAESIDDEAVSSKKGGNSPSQYRSAIFNFLSMLLLLSVLSFTCFLLITTVYKSVELEISHDSLPPSYPENHTEPNKEKEEGEGRREKEEGREEKGEIEKGDDRNPTVYKVGDVKLPRLRQPHPEEFDVDDLPFSRGMNPTRKQRQTVFYRIPSFIHPLSYNVTLDVKVKGRNGASQSTIHGHSLIHFRATSEPSNLLEFHAYQLNIASFKLMTTKMDIVNPISHRYNEEKQAHVRMLERPMKEGEEFYMEITWTTLARTTGVMGAYETWETRSDGTRAYQLATQGETMGTRKWMPAFDEPALKATLSLTINHPSELNARSNAPIKSSNKSVIPGFRTTEFATTKRMSPYLYAWSLTDYEELSKDVHGVKVSVIAAHNRDRSLDCAEFAVDKYFSVLSINQSHIFDKMDFVVVPDHLSAMENVGHITIRNTLIFNCYMYTHEMMHQYFGNLITLSWWDEVWINEGLTTMYEIDASHGIGTKSALVDLRRRRNEHILKDSLRKTIALKNEVTTEVEADANFEKSYSKGSVVLFMMRNVVGEEAWKEGVETFLNKFAFQAVKGDDFLRTIKEVSMKYHNDKIPEFAYGMAKDFFELKGFPLLKFKRDGRKIELSQIRFVRGIFDDPTKENISLSTHYWRIPIHLTKLDGTHYKTILMTSKVMKLKVDTDDELILDPKKIVYCRVVYDRSTYHAMSQSKLQWDDLEPIITDLAHSSFSGYVEPQFAFDVIFADFKLIGRSMITNMLLKPLSTMFTFDSQRLGRIKKLLKFGSVPDENASKEINKFADIYNKRAPDPCESEKIHTIDDAVKAYSKNRYKMHFFFCPHVKNTTTEKVYGELFLKSFVYGNQQIFHPQDIDMFISSLKNHYPNLIPNMFVEASERFESHIFSPILHLVRDAFDIKHTQQLREIFANSPQAARENRDFITRIFNEHYAAISEAKELGNKIESALMKLQNLPKFPKNNRFSSFEEQNFVDVTPESIHSQKLNYY